jgi:hypothetical protein
MASELNETNRVSLAGNWKGKRKYYCMKKEKNLPPYEVASSFHISSKAFEVGI